MRVMSQANSTIQRALQHVAEGKAVVCPSATTPAELVKYLKATYPGIERVMPLGMVGQPMTPELAEALAKAERRTSK